MPDALAWTYFSDLDVPLESGGAAVELSMTLAALPDLDRVGLRVVHRDLGPETGTVGVWVQYVPARDEDDDRPRELVYISGWSAVLPYPGGYRVEVLGRPVITPVGAGLVAVTARSLARSLPRDAFSGLVATRPGLFG